MPQKADKTEILSRTNLFGNLHKPSIKALAEICLPRLYKKNEPIFREGQKGFFVYVLVSGSVQLNKTAPDGRDIVIKVVKPGEIFAEVILFEQDRYPVNAVALTTANVYQIPKKQFECLLNDDTFRKEFVASLMSKMRYLAGRIQYLSSHDVEDRLYLFLEEQYGRETRMKCSLSKKQIATAIGATPETLSRLLSRLKEQQRLVWEKDSITIAPEVWEGR